MKRRRRRTREPRGLRPSRHVNHRCDANAYERDSGEDVFIVARRRIAPDEEIAFDYNINTSGGESWPCNCGAPRCRGESVGEFLRLPREVQLEYRPLLAEWFTVCHRAQLQQLDAAALRQTAAEGRRIRDEQRSMTFEVRHCQLEPSRFE